MTLADSPRCLTLSAPDAPSDGELVARYVRTANKARVMNAKEARLRQPPVHLNEYPTPTADPADADTLAVVDAELAALPDRYRAAFVACVLNDRSRSEAARELGWPEGTVARLAKARELLAARLRKRGVTLAVGAFAAVTVPAATASGALDPVRQLSAVGTASAVAPTAQTLTDEVVKTVTASYPKWLAVGDLYPDVTKQAILNVLGPGLRDRSVRVTEPATTPDEPFDPSAASDRQALVNVVRRHITTNFPADWNIRCGHVARYTLLALEQLGVSGYRLAAGRVEKVDEEPPSVLYPGNYSGTGGSPYHAWVVNSAGEKIDCSVVPTRYGRDHLWEPFAPIPALRFTEIPETTRAVEAGLARSYPETGVSGGDGC